METSGGEGIMCTWVQSVSKRAHTLKVEGKLSIQMRPVKDDQVDPCGPVVVRSNHLKHYDMSNFLIRKFSSAVIFLAIHKTCSCLSKCSAIAQCSLPLVGLKSRGPEGLLILMI